MIRLAMAGAGARVQKREIAAAEGISGDYVVQILMRLRTAGLVNSRRGVHGGFTLTQDSGGVSVADVLHAVEGPLDLAPCARGQCRRVTTCVARTVWDAAREALEAVFSGTTIEELAGRALEAQSAADFSYEI